MSDWWTYRFEDLLLFSPRVYWRLFELHNAAWWPLHVVTFGIGLIIVLLLLRQPKDRGLRIAFALAAFWAFVGLSFLWNSYASINWAVAYFAPAFWLQALMLATSAAGGYLTFDRRDAAGRLGLSVAVAGLVAYPLLSPLLGRPWAGAELFGIAPDPTAIVTLGVLLATSGRLVALLYPILLLSGLTLHSMGDPQAWAPFSAAGAAVVLLVVRRLLR